MFETAPFPGLFLLSVFVAVVLVHCIVGVSILIRFSIRTGERPPGIWTFLLLHVLMLGVVFAWVCVF